MLTTRQVIRHNHCNSPPGQLMSVKTYKKDYRATVQCVRPMLCTVITAWYFLLFFPCLSLRWRYEYGGAQRSIEGTWSCCPSGTLVQREGEITETQTSELSWDLCAFCSLHLSREKKQALPSVWGKIIWLQFLIWTKECCLIMLSVRCSAYV